MVMRPVPFRQHCPDCDWRGQEIALRSDAIAPAEFARLQEHCPRCGASNLQEELMQGMSGSLLSRLGRLISGRP